MRVLNCVIEKIIIENECGYIGGVIASYIQRKNRRKEKKL